MSIFKKLSIVLWTIELYRPYVLLKSCACRWLERSLMCNVNVVNRIPVNCFCLIIFSGDWGGFGHPVHPLTTSLLFPIFLSFCLNLSAGSFKNCRWISIEFLGTAMVHPSAFVRNGPRLVVVDATDLCCLRDLRCWWWWYVGNSKNFAVNSRSRQRVLELMRERLIISKKHLVLVMIKMTILIQKFF